MRIHGCEKGERDLEDSKDNGFFSVVYTETFESIAPIEQAMGNVLGSFECWRLGDSFDQRDARRDFGAADATSLDFQGYPRAKSRARVYNEMNREAQGVHPTVLSYGGSLESEVKGTQIPLLMNRLRGDDHIQVPGVRSLVRWFSPSIMVVTE